MPRNHVRRFRLGRHSGSVVALFVVTFLPAVSSRADEIQTVVMSDAGPDREIPTDRSFYVSGTVAPNTQSVQAVVLKKGSNSVFGDQGPSCSAAASARKVESLIKYLLDARRY